MHHDLAYLHTSPVHVATFDALTKELAPSLRIRHVIREDLLADAQKLGATDEAIVERVQAAMIDAASSGAAMVVCTCSTIGGAAERTPRSENFSAARIDRAMADRAVELGPAILVVAALGSTLEPTTRLLEESARVLDRPIRVEHLLIASAWPLFVSGDRDGYLREIGLAVRREGSGLNVVVLAQASMAPAADALGDLGVEVLASPRLGVTRALRVLGRIP